MKKLHVNLGEHSYDIHIANGLLDKVASKIKELTNCQKIGLITDENVLAHHGQRMKKQLEGYEVVTIALPPGEATKNFDNLPNIYEQLLHFKLTRSDLIIALGGGVIGDLAGYVAASYLRGVNFIQIPTSLLAMVDSSVGGKVGVNLPQGKNLIGAFYQPKAVFIDPDVLSTLPDLYFTDGMAEVIKYGCIFDQPFFQLLKNLHGREAVMAQIEHIVYTCCDIKRQVVETDEKDTGLRMILNFGHSLAHAIENYHHYTGITHGYAVAIGMYMTTLLAEQNGISPNHWSTDIQLLLQQHGLPTTLQDAQITQLDDTIRCVIANDKKNINGTLKEIVLSDLGKANIVEVSLDFFTLQ